MHRILTILALGLALMAAGEARAQTTPPDNLRGDFAVLESGSCLYAVGGFNANFTPIGTYFVLTETQQAVRTFDGKGGGTEVGYAVDVIGSPYPDVSSVEYAAAFTYQMATNGTFTALPSGPVTGTIMTGAQAGQTFTITAINPTAGTGQIGIDRRDLFLATSVPYVEQISYSNGDTVYRVCSRGRSMHQITPPPAS
ncbi:MAG TPA: hypothetical protein VE397_09310 [Stellaceae bacterium]|nr:hypothetical protein [Stellaceae bacterium]